MCCAISRRVYRQSIFQHAAPGSPQAFAAPGTPAATTASLESIDKLRDEVMEELGKAKPNPPGISAAVDRYAPQLHRIIQSIDASVSPPSAGVPCLALGMDRRWVGFFLGHGVRTFLTSLFWHVQTDPVRLTQRMQFQWTSALNTQALSEFKTQEASNESKHIVLS